MLGRGKLGAGKEARFHYFERSRVPYGARFVLRGTPADAVTLGVTQLVAEGFTAREDDLDARLRQMGSPWRAQAVEIGTADVSWRKQYLQDVIEDTPLIFLNRFQRKISPTLVMAAAQHLPDATIELVLYPHTSRKGDPEGSFGAATRLLDSVEAIAAASAANGTLVSHEKLIGIRNDGSPASQQMVRELLGWR